MINQEKVSYTSVETPILKDEKARIGNNFKPISNGNNIVTKTLTIPLNKYLNDEDVNYVLKDDIVNGLHKTILEKVNASKYHLLQGGRALDPKYNFIKDWIDSFYQDLISYSMLATVFGSQTIEFKYPKLGDNYINFLPTAINKIERGIVFYDKFTENLYYRKLDGKTVVLSPLVYTRYVNREIIMNENGDDSASILYPLVKLRQEAIIDWGQFLDMYSRPPRILKSNTQNQQDVDLRLHDMSLAGGLNLVISPDEDFMQIPLTGDVSSQAIFLGRIETLITRFMLGQNLTSEVGSNGSFAATKVHQEILNDRIDSYKRFISDNINIILKKILLVNGLENLAIVFCYINEHMVNLDLVNRDKVLFDMGVEFSKSYICKAYGFEDSDITSIKSINNTSSGGID
jgi:hypothetical protein